ncbi:MAG: hypothetical protein H6Q75_1329 [Firmicutes bacterium]|nr:hypothetical protein [Bacillota bacterium]
MKLGARIVKTGIAVTITMSICKYFSLEPAFFGAVSAIVNMQPSIFLTLKMAVNQIVVHVVGVFVGLLLGYLFGGNPVSMGVITILIIAIYIKLRLEAGITMGIIAALFVVSGGQDQFITHALARTSVIFVGLGTAMIINIALWPPRYSKQFPVMIRESNEASVRYFCQAITSYVQLENQEPELDSKQQESVYRLNRKVRDLYELLKREEEVIASAQKQHLDVLGKLIAYNESITKKADRIYDLIPGRVERRIQAGTPEISNEFRVILQMLENSTNTIMRLNQKLRSVLIDGMEVQLEEIKEDYWEQLSQAVEAWQPMVKGTYHFHGLMDAIVTANEIKWASREAKRLLAESLSNFSENQAEEEIPSAIRKMLS